MSKLLYSFCFFAFTGFFTATSYAQQPALGCNDKAMRLQAEQMKRDFIAQGLTVYKDAMATMESKQPFPIAVQLEKGKMYQMVFIGSNEVKKMTMELYDGQDNKIDEKSLKPEGSKNFIVYSIVPERSDMYLVVLTQAKGMKSMCGSFMIMQTADVKAKTQATQPAPTKQEAPKTNPRYTPKK